MPNGTDESGTPAAVYQAQRRSKKTSDSGHLRVLTRQEELTAQLEFDQKRADSIGDRIPLGESSLDERTSGFSESDSCSEEEEVGTIPGVSGLIGMENPTRIAMRSKKLSSDLTMDAAGSPTFARRDREELEKESQKTFDQQFRPEDRHSRSDLSRPTSTRQERDLSTTMRPTDQHDSMFGGDRKPNSEPDFTEFLLGTWYRDHRDRERDRENMLKFERILDDMLTNRQEQKYSSPPLNSYYRMLFHRMADVWAFEHSVDSSKGQPIVCLRLLPESRRPYQLFRDLENDSVPVMPADEQPSPSPSNVYILKRPQNHALPGTASPAQAPPVTPLSLEERRANYARVREQIFGQDDSGTGEEITPQPYGLSPNPSFDDGSSQTSQAAYHRSRSLLSDVSSEANYDLPGQSVRQIYGDPYAGQGLVRPMMQGHNLYGSPYGGYATGSLIGGYPGATGPDGSSYLDPVMLQQMQQMMIQQHQSAQQPQQQYCPPYGGPQGAYQSGPSGPNTMYSSGMQYGQPAYSHPAYSSPQGSFDQAIPYTTTITTSQYYHQPATALLAPSHHHQHPGYVTMETTGGGSDPSNQHPSPAHSTDSSGGGGAPYAIHQRYPPAANHPSPLDYSPQRNDPTTTSGNGLNDAYIVPLHFPPSNPTSQWGMFLKLPCARGPVPGGPGSGHHGDWTEQRTGNGRRMSRNNSGRNSVDRHHPQAPAGGPTTTAALNPAGKTPLSGADCLPVAGAVAMTTGFQES